MLLCSATFTGTLNLIDESYRHGPRVRASAVLIDKATAAGKPLELRVLPVNTDTRRLYERLGFVVTRNEGEFVCMRHAACTAAP